MLIAEISDQLGNQMFTYASIKSIAQDRKESFYFVRAHNPRINDNDPKYGNEIHTIFPNTYNDFLIHVPEDQFNTYHEPPLQNRKTNYQEAALNVPENTIMTGHFISYRYFAHNLEHVRNWFEFPEDIHTSVIEELYNLRQKYPNRPLVAVHFRIGDDYVKQGFRIGDSYWKKAASHIRCNTPEEPVFLLFYDKKSRSNDIIDYFSKKYTCEICRGSLVHDLCMMSKCDKQIICNSSFSIMSAILNTHPKEVCRPSVYPVGKRFYPEDCFPEDWTVIPARQSLYSRLQFSLMSFKGIILQYVQKGRQ